MTSAWRRIAILILFAGALGGLLAPVPGLCATNDGTRVALVIGNGAYRNLPALPNSVGDARLIAHTLKGLGFTVIGGDAQVDLDHAAFAKVIQAFGDAVATSKVAIVYYAGHGLQMAGENYLIPVDANPTKAADADFQLIPANIVLHQLDGDETRLNVVILDACRNNPFGGRGLRDVASGLAQMQAPAGTLIAYATQPGNVAQDGPQGGHGPYATALAEAMATPNLDVFQMFNRVGLQVSKATAKTQEPWLSSSPVEGDFYFAGGAATTPGVNTEVVFWQSIANGNRAEDFQAYLTRYPNGEFALLARSRLQALSATPQSPSPASSQASTTPPSPPKTTTIAMATPPKSVTAVAPPPRASSAAFMNKWQEAFARRDYASALNWARQAADAGDGDGMLRVGEAYKSGLGVRPDYALAMSWFGKAADLANREAMNEIGFLYRNGLGVPRDYAQAMRWYQRAAKLDYPVAMVDIGVLYENGLGVAKDHQEAMRWWRKAAALGDDRARSKLAMYGER